MTDFYDIAQLLSDEHLLIKRSIAQFISKEIEPIIETAAEKAEFPSEIVKKLGSVGAFGADIPIEYGGGGMDHIAYGIIMEEIERCDSGVRSTASVQSSLVMYPIYAFGTASQKKKYLPGLASGELLGCFGLTEPDVGSNPSALTTKITKTAGGYLLNGAKMWITNSPEADIAIVWAKNENKRITGIIVDCNSKGVSTPEIKGKWSLRASTTGELVFENVFISEDQILPEKDGLGAPLMCLDKARYGISWGAIGAAKACYECALNYAKERNQFGKPIASFQLTQKKLSEMLTEITKAQLLSLRLGQLMNEGKASTAQISMAKRNNVKMALDVARESRQILGAMGITGEFPIMRHIMNLESVITYEGTHDIHLLILGADITDIPAFS